MIQSRRKSVPTGMRCLPALVFMLLAAAACGEKERSYVANIGDGDRSPTMTTYDVETFISDSGYTRYHISTPVWMMFEEASEPFWRFPDGLDLQQYDLRLNPDATMVCDSAIYFSRKRLWRLDGHVIMVNSLRDSFLSQQLFWDQAKRRVFTDSFIHIVRSDRIIEGYGFESNENMTAYTINNPTAILPVNRKFSSDSESVTDSVSSPDTIRPADRRRQAPKRTVAPAAAPQQTLTPAPAPDGNQRLKLQTSDKI